MTIPKEKRCTKPMKLVIRNEHYADLGGFVFILPPSWDMLEESLRARRSDAPEEIEPRLNKVRDETTCFNEYELVAKVAPETEVEQAEEEEVEKVDEVGAEI